MDAGPPELMTIALARTIRDGEVVGQGVDSILPSLAILLARATHAPSLTWITVAGGINPRLAELPSTSVSPRWLSGTPVIFSNPEFYRLAMRGGIDRMFLGAAQIDQRGRLNSTAIGPRDHPRVRLPGGGGAAVLAQVVHHVVVWRTRHTKQVFVPAVDFVTAQGNVEAVVTPLGMLALRDGRLILETRFPGILPEDVQAGTGFPVLPENDVPVLEPTDNELRIIQGLDPHRQRDLEFSKTGRSGN